MGCVCVWGGGGGGGGGGGDSAGKRAICDRVQLLTLAKACNRFLMCAVYRFHFHFETSFSKEGAQ